MTKSQTDPDIFFTNQNDDASNNGKIESTSFEGQFQDLLKLTQQVPRLLSQAEDNIIRSICKWLKIWHQPWKDAFLAGDREFKIVYELMEGLLHYEDQITNSESILSSERTNAIAQAVARLVDYGNAILNIDLIIRASDDASTELEPVNKTTIELFQAHVKANNLREKLLYDYFKKDKPNGSCVSGMLIPCLVHTPNSSLLVDDTTQSSLVTPTNTNNNGTTPFVGLQVPLLPNKPASLQHSPTFERSHRSSVGSNTSINTAVSEGRRTPQFVTPAQIEVKLYQTEQSYQIELTHMLATIRSCTFSAIHSSTTRLTLLPGILAKIEDLLSVPTYSEKVTACFELLDALLDTIERLPVESRSKEINLISTALLKPIVHKVHIDDRENLVEFQHAHWTTCLISILKLMTADDFNNYLRHFGNLVDLSVFLKDYLFIVKRLMSKRDEPNTSNQVHHSNFGIVDTEKNGSATFPNCWIEMTLICCSTFLRSLTFLYQFLKQYFASNSQMRLSFIECLIQFILHDALDPNRFMLKDRQRFLADDLRQTSAEYVWISWDSLNQQQKQQLLEDLIEPLLRASMNLHSKQRSILLPIFYDMMRCDYTSQYITPRISLSGTNSSSHKNTMYSQPIRDFSSQVSDFLSDDDLESLPPISSSHQQQQPNAFVKTNSMAADEDSLPYLSFHDIENGGGNEDGTVLTRFTHLIVGKLNNLMIDLSLGDERFKIELCAAIAGQLNPKYYNRNSPFSTSTDTTQFKCMAKQTSDLISEFIQICLDLRQAEKLSYNHLYLLFLFKLIMFFRDKVDRVELYLGYLYKLFRLHHGSGRFIEAGYTLLEHAKTLPWSDRPLESHFRLITRFFKFPTQPQPPPPNLTDHSSLKSFLYTKIIDNFDQGQLWEAAVPLCRELMDVYEFKTYEFAKLAQILEKMSSFFQNIIDIGRRSNPEYFRVTFYGIGFPPSIRNTTMIYRGRPYEKLADFQATMLNKYPDANLLTSLAKPSDIILNASSEARYLQINACSPIVDLKCKFGVDLPKIDETVLAYYRYNECDKFSFSRRIASPIVANNISVGDNNGGGGENFADMWREKTTLMTNTLPGVLPFFPVYLIETSIVSPIESAIEDLERTNDRLSCMVNRFKADKRQAEDVRLLGQLLLGVVDAAINGGITKYEQAFFGSSAAAAGTTTSLSFAAGANSADLTNRANFDATGTTTQRLHHDNKQESTRGNKLMQQQRDTTMGSMASVDGKVDKLKCLIAQQVPLLDVAIQLHRDRVADVMRPQHEHLEAAYKRLKHHVMTKYYRYLPADYSRSSQRSFRTLARSPNRSLRSSEFRFGQLTMGSSSSFNTSGSNSGRLASKRMSDAGSKPSTTAAAACESTSTTNNVNGDGSGRLESSSSSSIPYRPLSSERRSLPFLTGVPIVDRDVIRGHMSDGNKQQREEEEEHEEEEEEEEQQQQHQEGTELIPTQPPQASPRNLRK